MEMSGRWGFVVNDSISDVGGMWFVTPGKWVSKNSGSKVVGDVERCAKCADGRKRVHVNDPS